MMAADLTRLIVRHRHVSPMLSALLGGTHAAVRIIDAAGTVALERNPLAIVPGERFPISVEGETLGWVEGDAVARAVAAVLSYACAREADKRSLAREALDRYRELNLVYDLAERLGGELDADAIGAIAQHEAGRLVRGDGLLRTGAPGILGAVEGSGVAEIINDVTADPRADGEERRYRSLAAAPVTARGATLAVLAAGSEEPRELTSADLKLLTAIAAIVGPVLDRARLAAPRETAALAER